MKSPAICWRLHAIEGGYKQTCFRQNAVAGSFLQIVGDFMQLKEVCFKGVLNYVEIRNGMW
ncbi:hypothetical protein [Chryseobacterium shandongense]|uniref:hypothetical protein n=1 Tax=Chryseobacterium shandongense TaxID=1493872 RepID=UPI000F4E319D|nr:hypothetical protein [Chryseobacterium shandongense]AZA58069.1 hypothetical protein EG350_13130 [Chryseobacterium shandongense]